MILSQFQVLDCCWRFFEINVPLLKVISDETFSPTTSALNIGLVERWRKATEMSGRNSLLDFLKSLWKAECMIKIDDQN